MLGELEWSCLVLALDEVLIRGLWCEFEEIGKTETSVDDPRALFCVFGDALLPLRWMPESLLGE